MNDETLDRSVREAIEPDDDTVARVIRDALRAERPRRRVVGPALLAAAALMLVLGSVLLLKRDRVPAQMRVMNVGDTVVVKPATGGVWLIGGNAGDAVPLAAGTIIVYRSGGRP